MRFAFGGHWVTAYQIGNMKVIVEFYHAGAYSIRKLLDLSVDIAKESVTVPVSQ